MAVSLGMPAFALVLCHAGKSALLMALLGELASCQGMASVQGSIAYAAQDPWIMSVSIRYSLAFSCPLPPSQAQSNPCISHHHSCFSSCMVSAAAQAIISLISCPKQCMGILLLMTTSSQCLLIVLVPCAMPHMLYVTWACRENILYGRNFDSVRYADVLHACALVQDLRIMSHGDATYAGDRGAALSGGQRMRIALARAIYQVCAQMLRLHSCHPCLHSSAEIEVQCRCHLHE